MRPFPLHVSGLVPRASRLALGLILLSTLSPVEREISKLKELVAKIAGNKN